MQDKILISACFLGCKVRYNGEVKALTDELITLWQSEGRFVVICPEVEGGLSVPRAPAEIDITTGKVYTQSGIDVTQEFNYGAQRALALCQQFNIRFALLKEASPSCGSHLIYNGAFSVVKVVGEGITTKLLRAHAVNVFSEDNLGGLVKLLDQPLRTSQ